jgi:hypothetical protein
MDRFTFPAFTNVWVVLSIFTAEVVLFHLLLVFWLKIGKRGWKIVDYIWLSLAVVGNIRSRRSGSPPRRNRHGGKFKSANPNILLSSFLSLINTARRDRFAGHLYGASSGRLPPFQRAQKEYDSVCH